MVVLDTTAMMTIPPARLARRTAALLCVGCLLAPAFAQTPTLVRDIHNGPAAQPRSSSQPAQLVQLGNSVLFAATSTAGRELHRTDATAASTVLVRDLAAGTISSDPEHLTVVGGLCYFSAALPGLGREPFRSDGTAAGTIALGDLAPGLADSNPGAFTAFGGAVYFLLGNGSYDLWRTDGTSAGTTLVRKNGTASGDAVEVSMVVTGGRLLFGAPNPWVSDGTAAGTKPIATFAVREMVSLGQVAIAHDGVQLYGCTTNLAVPLGTTQSRIAGLRAAGGVAYFAEQRVDYSNNYPNYYEVLRRCDSLGKVSDYIVTPWNAQILGTSGADVYTYASQSGRWQVWKNAYPHVSIVNPPVHLGPGGDIYYPDSGRVLTRFVAATSQHVRLGTEPVARPSGWLTLPSGSILYPGLDPLRGDEPHLTDGTPANTGLLADVYPTPSSGDNESSEPQWLHDAAGLLYFSAVAPGVGREPYVSDGTPAGTNLLLDLVPGPASSDPGEFTTFGTLVAFSAATSGSSRQLWVTDGTAAGTRVLPGGDPRRLVVAGEYLFYQALSGSTYALWRSDGSYTGTVFVQQLGDSYAHPMVGLGRSVFFPVRGQGLWMVQGAGTPQLVQAGLVPDDYKVVGDQLYFGAIQPSGKAELWRVHGSGSGATKLVDMSTAGGSFVEYQHWDAANQRMFLWSLTGTRRAVFATDGTQGGTSKLPVDHSGGLLGARFGSIGQRTLLRPPGSLWSSDGTPANTTLVRRLWERAGESTEVNWNNFAIEVDGRKLVFPADDGWHGLELWVTDGTNAGTRILADVNPGAADGLGGSLSEPVVSGGRLLFPGSDPNAGAELWAVDLGAIAQPIGSGCSSALLAPQLTADAPLLGRASLVRIEHGGANRSGVALLGWPSPGFKHTAFGGGCTGYLDFARGTLALGVRTDAGGRWIGGFSVPNLPALKGL
ncbi:MAG: hypothetical protein KDC87_18990, partial [Planctomycetes bacterium]|nr:hypothetical protein [Planctomycetota bacterium]